MVTETRTIHLTNKAQITPQKKIKNHEKKREKEKKEKEQQISRLTDSTSNSTGLQIWL